MELCAYLSEIDRIADDCLDKSTSVHEYMEKLTSESADTVEELIQFRKELLTQLDCELVSGYLATGLFRNYDHLERIALLNITFEIERLKAKKGIVDRCKTYDPGQPLFKRIPELLGHIQDSSRPELIDYGILTPIDDSEIVSFRNKYAKIDAYLHPGIVSWSRANFPNSPMFVRLEPDRVYTTRPLRRLYEEILVPANPNWWRNLSIRNRTKTGASYFLEDCKLLQKTAGQIWEYRIKHLRRLEVSARRDNNGYLSMMLEELNEADRNSDYIVCKCIHLDTKDPVGTDFGDSVLKHLDLAINVYCDDKIDERYRNNLADGRVEDASYRTHLFRIEKIPFSALLAYVVMFFDSKIMTAEWIADQFSGRFGVGYKNIYEP